MSDEPRTTDGVRAYPRDLAKRVRALWPPDCAPLPASLEAVFDTAYHASFLREEERPVTFRLVVAPPSTFAANAGPPAELLALPFEHRRGFDEHELRRLSQAAKYHRALIAIDEVDGVLSTWGIVQSGPRWLQVAYGGRAKEPPMPNSLVLRVARPGHIAVSCGSQPIAELRGGALTDFTLDVFASKWMPRLFKEERAEVAMEHRGQGGVIEAEMAAELTGKTAQQMLKRIVSTIRSAHHGGTVLILPPTCAANRYLHTKYALAEGDGRRHFRHLVLALLRAKQEGRSKDGFGSSELEEALFELGHLVAALADVDGAVVLTKRFEILGFGAEIAGELPDVREVRRALDVEGEAWELERVDRVGTRHRSAFRLCAAIPGALAVVISQDMSVRFVTWKDDAIVYWDHGAGDL